MSTDFLACEIELTDGRILRFGPDEADPSDVVKGLSFATQNPGGFHTASFTLARPPSLRADDALLFNGVRIYGPGGVTAYEGRVTGVPQVGPHEVSMELEGWAAHLDDDESFREIYIDKDLGKWGEPSTQRKIDAVESDGRKPSVNVSTGSQESGATGPGVMFEFTELDASVIESGESWYYGEGVDLGELRYSFHGHGTDADFTSQAHLFTDDVGTAGDAGTDHNAASVTDRTLTATDSGRKYARVADEYAGATTGETALTHAFYDLAVIGRHGLTERGIWPDIGFYNSDLLADVVGRAAPSLNFTTGVEGSIEAATGIISQFVATEPGTTARSLVEQLSAYGTDSFQVPDWGVYDDRTFYWRTPGTYGRTWRVRRDQVANPVSAGPDSSKRCRAVFISYQNGAGQNFTVGPPGSGAHAEYEALEDTDPTNPAQTKIRHRGVGTTFEEGAVRLGQVLLYEFNRIRWRGSVEVKGEAADENGVTYPAWAIRAGDQLFIEDEEEPELMPISATSYSHDSMSNGVTIGDPVGRFEVLLANLERTTAQ